jgi:hypothetical protein
MLLLLTHRFDMLRAEGFKGDNITYSTLVKIAMKVRTAMNLSTTASLLEVPCHHQQHIRLLPLLHGLL